MQLVQVVVVQVLPPSVQVDCISLMVGVVQWDAFKAVLSVRHKLPEYADAAVPKSRLGEMSHDVPLFCFRVVGLDHVRKLKGVVIPARHVQFPSKRGQAPSNVNLQ